VRLNVVGVCYFSGRKKGARPIWRSNRQDVSPFRGCFSTTMVLMSYRLDSVYVLQAVWDWRERSFSSDTKTRYRDCMENRRLRLKSSGADWSLLVKGRIDGPKNGIGKTPMGRVETSQRNGFQLDCIAGSLGQCRGYLAHACCAIFPIISRAG